MATPSSARPLSNDPPIDEARFTQVWLQQRAEILRICRRYTDSEADAQEVVSRVAFLLCRKLPVYAQRIDNLRGWVLRMAFNACMSLHRENRRRAEQSLDEVPVEAQEIDLFFPAPTVEDPEEEYLQREMRRFLARSIGDLPERLRETVVGHLSSGSYREIADRLGINEANARKRMQEARAILSRRLADYRSGAVPPPSPAPAEPPRRPRSRRPPSPPEEGGRGIRALRSATIDLPSQVQSEGLVALRHRPDRTPRAAAGPAPPGETTEEPSARPDTAQILLEQGRLAEAAAELEAAVERRPDRLETWLDLIAAYRLLEREDAVLDACDRGAAKLRGPGPSSLLHGLREETLERSAAAEQSFSAAAAALPESPAPWTALAELRLAAGRAHEALAALDAALGRDPDDVSALTLGHEALRLAGRSGEGRRRNARALAIDGANPPALERRLLACALAAGGRREALRDERGAELPPTRPAAQSLLALLEMCGSNPEGMRRAAAFVRQHPRLRQARLEQARLLDILGKPLAGLQELEIARSLTLGQSCRELDRLACRLAVRAGLSGRALLEAEVLLVRFGDAWDTASTAAWAFAWFGRVDRALEVSRTAVDGQCEVPAAWLEHGRVLAACGRLREAAAALETGWALLPRDDGFELAAPAALDLAKLHRRLGDERTAAVWNRSALASCEALRPEEPVRAGIWHTRAAAELGQEPTPGALPGSAAFREIVARQLLTSQISEASFR